MTLPLAVIPAHTHPTVAAAAVVLVAAAGLFVQALTHPFAPLSIDRGSGKVRTR